MDSEQWPRRGTRNSYRFSIPDPDLHCDPLERPTLFPRGISHSSFLSGFPNFSSLGGSFGND